MFSLRDGRVGLFEILGGWVSTPPPSVARGWTFFGLFAAVSISTHSMKFFECVDCM